MMYVKYVLLKPAFYGLLILVGLLSFTFAMTTKDSHDTLNTMIESYQNTDFQFVGTSHYRAFTDNTYYDHGYDVQFYDYASEDGMHLKGSLYAHIYQEIPDSTYGKMSYFNSENITEGDFNRLKDNEIAISSNLAKKHGLAPGDTLFAKPGDTLHSLEIAYIFAGEMPVGDTDLNESAGMIMVNQHTDIAERSSYLSFFESSSAMFSSLSTRDSIMDEWTSYRIIYLLFSFGFYLGLGLLSTLYIFSSTKAHMMHIGLKGEDGTIVKLILFTVSVYIGLPLLIGAVIQAIIFQSVLWILPGILAASILISISFFLLLRALRQEVFLFDH